MSFKILRSSTAISDKRPWLLTLRPLTLQAMTTYSHAHCPCSGLATPTGARSSGHQIEMWRCFLCVLYFFMSAVAIRMRINMTKWSRSGFGSEVIKVTFAADSNCSRLMDCFSLIWISENVKTSNPWSYKLRSNFNLIHTKAFSGLEIRVSRIR